MRIDAKDSIRIVGILAVLIGIWGLFKSVKLCVSVLSFVRESGTTIGSFLRRIDIGEDMSCGPWQALLLSIFFLTAVAIYFLVSGFGLLSLKRWSRENILAAAILAMFFSVGRFLMLGPYTEEVRYLLVFLYCGFLIWFFNRKSVTEQFPPFSKIELFFMIVLVTVGFLLASAGWLYLWGFKMKAYQWPGLQKAVYTAKDESFYSANYFRSPFPLKYTVAVPNQITLFNIQKEKGYGVEIILYNAANPGLDRIWLFDEKPGLEIVFRDSRKAWQLLGYPDFYQFCKKVFCERYGVLFQLYRSIYFKESTCKLDELRIADLEGFISKADSSNVLSGDYHVFRGCDFLGRVYVSTKKQQEPSGFDHINEIILSVLPQDSTFKSAQEFFQEGKTLFDANDFEKAKFSFASALCLDWDNADYHYYLGRAFYRTANFDSAKEHFKNAVFIRPPYSEALKLLQEIEMNRTDEK